jgi:transcriptional regulator with XRE-family HTH domain
MSQNELAARLEVTRKYVSHFENGRRLPGTEMMLQIATIFGITVDQLVRDDLEV